MLTKRWRGWDIYVPATANTTPVPAPVNAPAHTGSKHMVACGRKGACRKEKGYCSASDVKHEVRCCADKQPTDRKLKRKFKKRRGCSIWGASKVPKCYHGETYESAKNICAKAGARLCTKKEMESSCTKWTGCGNDADLIWTSDTCGEPANTTPAPA